MTRAVNVSSTTLPSWTTADRPSSPQVGQQGVNTTLNAIEVYDGNGWQNITIFSYSVSYAMLGGGGGSTGGTSGINYGAGGAAGVYRFGSSTFSKGQLYTITVGAGGAGVISGTPGVATNSSISGFGVSVNATFGTGPSSTSFAGGNNADFSGTNNPNGGTSSGAGAGAGGNASGFNGGVGATVTITGTTQTLGGGGGGASGAVNGSGGSGGGGNGNNSGSGSNGTANTGSGGGGSSSGFATNGGSGIVFLSIPTTAYSGIVTGSPTVTISGSFTILRFTTSGTYTA